MLIEPLHNSHYFIPVSATKFASNQTRHQYTPFVTHLLQAHSCNHAAIRQPLRTHVRRIDLIRDASAASCYHNQPARLQNSAVRWDGRGNKGPASETFCKTWRPFTPMIRTSNSLQQSHACIGQLFQVRDSIKTIEICVPDEASFVRHGTTYWC